MGKAARLDNSSLSDGGWVTGRLAHLVADETLAARARARAAREGEGERGGQETEIEPGSDCSRGAHHFIFPQHSKVKKCKNCGEVVLLRQKRRSSSSSSSSNSSAA